MRTWLRGAILAIGLHALCGPAQADSVTLTRADGASYTARLAGDWSGGCPPTLILSHGLGGDERALGYLDGPAEAAGFRVLVMEHRESGPQALRAILRGGAEALRGEAVWRGRAADLDAALAFATQECRPDPLVLGGHSMGAALTMFEAGARGTTAYRAGRRFDAYLAISPQGPSWAYARADAWAGVEAPVLMLTGTRDDGPDGTAWQNRLIAFEALPPGRKRLAIVEGASHFNLGGLGNRVAQRRAGQVAGEFLAMLREGWGPSALTGARGIEIREK